jgi:hypothetical protein
MGGDGYARVLDFKHLTRRAPPKKSMKESDLNVL